MATAILPRKSTRPVRYDLCTDGELCQRIGKGEGQAMTELYSRYGNKLAAFAGWYLGDEDDVADIVQETFVRIFRHAKNFNQSCKFTSWMYTIARRLCINRLRDLLKGKVTCYANLSQKDWNRLKHKNRDPEDDSAVIDFLDPKQDTHKDMERRQFSDRLLHLIAKLSENHQQVFVLREFRGLSYAQIARRTHVKVSTVKSRLFRAREALKDGLDPHQFH